ncbi:hypothetical protein LBMAG53_06000 [Planctomycetota bacterium]|nr:hypothetical protein LBMAG53_06000 [Planctomycetota bacterium]
MRPSLAFHLDRVAGELSVPGMSTAPAPGSQPLAPSAHADTYFHRLNRQTATRLWINNPTPAEATWAIAQGAVSCTSNPTYVARMLKEDRVASLACIDQALRESSDDAVVADLVQGRLLQRIMAIFAAEYDREPGRRGFVSVQGDPRFDTDSDHIITEVKRHRQLGRNYLAKIPATAAGLAAIEFCISEDLPCIATEVFSLSQALTVAELHRACSAKYNKRPILYLTHISGIFDDCLMDYAKTNHIDLPADLLRQAGLIVAREQYRQITNRGYEGIVMLGGGARGTHHFTEVVGGTMHVTVNPNTVEDLVKSNPPVVDRIHASVPASVVAELCRALPDLSIALVPGAQQPAEFEHYAPVKFFLAAFTKGWNALLAEIAARRAART